MSLKCPVCAGPLLQIPLHGRTTHICSRKHGRALSASAVRLWLLEEAVPIFDQALEKARAGARLCPRCQRKMMSVRFGQSLEIDHCESCSLIWFDQGEQETLPQRGAEEIERDEEPVLDMQVDYTLHFRTGLSPYENVKGDQSKFPLVTILLVLAFTAITHMAQARGFRGFLYNPSRPFAGLGIPAILSTFAHVNRSHLIGNALFFFLPGAIVESTLGEKVLLQVFGLAAFGSLVAEAILTPGTLSLGASAGIAGVFTVLCLTQPKAAHVTQDHGFSLRAFTFYTFTYRVPMWMVFAGWLLTQVGGGWDQIAGHRGGISYVGHLAGILAGVAYVFSTDLKVLSPNVRRAHG